MDVVGEPVCSEDEASPAIGDQQRRRRHRGIVALDENGAELAGELAHQPAYRRVLLRHRAAIDRLPARLGAAVALSLALAPQRVDAGEPLKPYVFLVVDTSG